jgi:ketosteroid isomerase-like protein
MQEENIRHGHVRRANVAREQGATTMDKLLAAADRLDVIELGARFDNALDAENRDRFIGTFLSDGVLAGFWGEATGPEQIGAAFDFMLATFARGRRHVVTNHEVTVTGDSATMFSVMTVQDRTTNATIGTAAFTDTLARDGDGWRFVRRTLAADPNVQPIIDGLMAHQAA